MTGKIACLGVALASVCLSSALARAQAYTVTDLKSLPPYYWITPLGINRSGEVVGAASKVQNYVDSPGLAFYWTEAKGIQSLGTGYATAINNIGDITGEAVPPSHAFLWKHDGTTQDLGTLGGYSNYAFAINSTDSITGDSTTTSNVIPAFLWTPSGGMLDLGTLGDANALALGQGVNDSGQVVGWSSVTTQDAYAAFLWTESGGMQDLGPGGGDSFAYAINKSGLIVGEFCQNISGDNCYALLWPKIVGGGTQDLGTLGGNKSAAYAINGPGTVVGGSTTTTASNSPNHAFMWTAAGGMQDLNLMVSASTQSKWVLVAGNAINDAGQIAVLAIPVTSTPISHALLLSPQMMVALTSSPNPSVVGQAVTFTTTVSSIVGAPPNGEVVTFKTGTTVLGTGTLRRGAASFTTSTLSKGTHAVTATYAGDPNYASAKSPAVNQVVN